MITVTFLNANIPLLERKCQPLKRKLPVAMRLFLFIKIFHPKYMALLSHETLEQMPVSRYNTQKIWLSSTYWTLDTVRSDRYDNLQLIL